MLDNLLEITDAGALADAEERIAKKRAMELYDNGRLAAMPVGTFEGLSEIHKTLFGDVYAFAGELRTVNIYKGDFRFTPVEGLGNAVKFVSIMPQSDFDEIIQKFIQMNTAHPFREGNGRAMRIWLDVMFAAALGKLVDWTKVDGGKYQLAMEHCAADSGDLVACIKPALTGNVGRTMFMRAIDASFAIEGYSNYKTENL